ncbi:hypothetical protein [Streptomyces wuyuanensis]|uniref:hypothetical protein n=1 Tax=Streptomyces wuyuanensis TaxID=1196353 RepID=UPI00378E93A0
MSGMRLMAVALALALALICALAAGIWHRVRKGDTDGAVRAAGITFAGAVGIVFMILTYLRPH